MLRKKILNLVFVYLLTAWRFAEGSGNEIINYFTTAEVREKESLVNI